MLGNRKVVISITGKHPVHSIEVSILSAFLLSSLFVTRTNGFQSKKEDATHEKWKIRPNVLPMQRKYIGKEKRDVTVNRPASGAMVAGE